MMRGVKKVIAAVVVVVVFVVIVVVFLLHAVAVIHSKYFSVSDPPANSSY